jgi:hypothetical protein
MSDTITLLDFGPSMVWFTSIWIPAGIEVRLTGIIDDDTGEVYDLDPYDADSAIPFNWELEGNVNEAGEWEWNGQGNPQDWNRNTVTRIKAFREC